MRKIAMFLVTIFLTSLCMGGRLQDQAKALIKADKAFYVYQDARSPKNHYIPSGYMGDYSDIKIFERCVDNPKTAPNCIKVKYSSATSQGAGWAGVYWLSPANNWGTRPGGYELTKAKKLTFWARGEQGNEYISEFKVGGIQGEYCDSDCVSLFDITLTKEWKKYEIDLTNTDMSLIIGGFAWATSLNDNPDGVTFYLDEVRYEF